MMQPEPVLQRELFSWPHNIDAFCHPSILTSLPLLAQAVGQTSEDQRSRVEMSGGLFAILQEMKAVVFVFANVHTGA